MNKEQGTRYKEQVGPASFFLKKRFRSLLTKTRSPVTAERDGALYFNPFVF